MAEMSFRRRNAGVVVHNGMLFVVGGDDGSSNLSSVEVSVGLEESSFDQNNLFFLVLPPPSGLLSGNGHMAHFAGVDEHWSQLCWRLYD